MEVYTGPSLADVHGAGSGDGGVYRPWCSSRDRAVSGSRTALTRHRGLPRSVTRTSLLSVTRASAAAVRWLSSRFVIDVMNRTYYKCLTLAPVHAQPSSARGR